MRAGVLLLVGQDQIGLQLGHRGDVDVFGATAYRDFIDPTGRLDAVSRPPHDPLSQAQGKEGIGIARHQGHDALRRAQKHHIAIQIISYANCHGARVHDGAGARAAGARFAAGRLGVYCRRVANKKKRNRSPKRRTGAAGPAAPSQSADGSDGAPEERARELATKALEGGGSGLGSSGLLEEIDKLSPQEAAAFLQLVEASLKKRRILLAGYLLCLIFMIGGMLAAFVIYAGREPDQFLGWVFLVPFALVGVTLSIFGSWSRRQ